MQPIQPSPWIRFKLWLGCGLVGLGLVVGPALAESPEDRLGAALTAYEQGMQSPDRDTRVQRFAESERLFRAALEQQGASAALWTNLGNAALQAERLGPAILAYRRALNIEPDYARAKQNLTYARERIPDWVPTPRRSGLLDTFFSWHQTLSRSTRATLAALSFAGICVLLSGGLIFRIIVLRYPAALLAIIWLALLGSLLIDPVRQAHREAVVVVPEAPARAADSSNAPLRFGQPLPAGSELRILEDRGGWLHIELHNGRDAWLTSSQVERIAAPES